MTSKMRNATTEIIIVKIITMALYPISTYSRHHCFRCRPEPPIQRGRTLQGNSVGYPGEYPDQGPVAQWHTVDGLSELLCCYCSSAPVVGGHGRESLRVGQEEDRQEEQGQVGEDETPNDLGGASRPQGQIDY